MTQNRIFLIYKGQLYLMKADAGMNHLQYMIHNALITHERDPEYENIIRGYFMAGHVYCYQGHRFLAPRGQDMRPAFKQLIAKLGLPEDIEVNFGVTKGEPGHPWYAQNSQHKLELVKWRINPKTS